MDNEEPREGVKVKAPFKKPVLAVELEESGKLSRREEEMAQEIERLKKRLNELERPVGKQRQNLEENVGLEATLSVPSVGSKGILQESAKGDLSGAMIPRLSST